MLANPERQIWFIPQRHLLAYRLIDSDQFFLLKSSIENSVRMTTHRPRIDSLMQP